MRALLVWLGILGALMLAVGGLVFAALVGGPWGVFVFAVWLLGAVVGVTDWYALRLRRRRQRRLCGAPALRP
jgi:hypothetical protein